MAIRLRGTGRAFTGRVMGLWGDAGSDEAPSTWMPLPQATARITGTLRLPTRPAARATVGAVNRADVALYSSLAAHSQRLPAGVHKHRSGGATGQATPLAAWEDEGGATALLK